MHQSCMDYCMHTVHKQLYYLQSCQNTSYQIDNWFRLDDNPHLCNNNPDYQNQNILGNRTKHYFFRKLNNILLENNLIKKENFYSFYHREQYDKVRYSREKHRRFFLWFKKRNILEIVF